MAVAAEQCAVARPVTHSTSSSAAAPLLFSYRVVKVLDRETAHLCCLASDCNEPAYTRLVKGLCHQNNISLLMVPTGQELGEWCGICKIDEDGNPRKVTRQSSATTCMLILLLTPLSLSLCVSRGAVCVHLVLVLYNRFAAARLPPSPTTAASRTPSPSS